MNPYLWLTSVSGLTLLSLILYKKTKKEFFSNPKTRFVKPSKAQAWLLADPDGYISSMSSADLHARQVLSPYEYRLKSSLSVIDLTDIHQHRLLQAVQKANKFFKTYRNFYLDPSIYHLPWWFIITNGSYEEGLPHTRGKYIFLTPKTLEQPMDLLVITLIHEKIHVYQRLNAISFQQKLIQMGHTIIGKRSDIPLIRANPDLDEYIYQDRSGKNMVLTYTSEKPSSIQDVVDSNGYEHPFEEIAYTISNHYKNE